MPRATIHIDGTASMSGARVGTWFRRYNGRTDRGVKLGDWCGDMNDGTKSPAFQRKGDLAYWFATQAREER